MDEIKKATSSFRNPYSCAQTIYAAFDGSDESKLAHYKENSGGRAPENMCGALFAALEIAPESARKEIAMDFAKRTGSTKCKEIKMRKMRSCRGRNSKIKNRHALRPFCSAFQQNHRFQQP